MIHFMRHYQLYFLISAIFLVPGIFALITWGMKPSIDFTGGTLLELQINKPDFNSDILKQLVEQNNIKISSLTKTEDNTYLLKADSFSQAINTNLQAQIASYSAQINPDPESTLSASIVEKRFETLGPSIGQQTLVKTISAISVVALVILGFVTLQFKDKKYGFCAILAMFHDTLILLGIFALLGHYLSVEVDTLFMTAVLTILSFSVHDTIVIYDRIRESQRRYPDSSYVDIIDKSINETLSRSVNNSMTIIFMLLALYLLGGETIRWFVFALLIGTVSGTYSSSFVAAPLLIAWDKIFGKK